MDVASTAQDWLRAQATLAGFDLVGFCGVDVGDLARERLRAFVAEGRHGAMGWFADRLDIRLDPRRLYPEAKSAMVLAAFYEDPKYPALAAESRVLVSRYAVGRDYHRTLRRRAAALIRRAGEHFPDIRGRVVVDSAPVPEKALAEAAGIGWQGKHTNLIHPERGSYFFLVVALLNVPLTGDQPIADRCGQCRRCVDACPTGALEPYRLDARRCISYLTIESGEAVPEEFEKNLNGWAFGCDICQEVCPYNAPLSGRTVRQVGWTDFAIRPPVEKLMRSGEVQSEAHLEELQTASALGRVAGAVLAANVRAARRDG